MVVANLPCKSVCSPPAAAEDPGMKSGAVLWPLHVSSNSVRASVAVCVWNTISHLEEGLEILVSMRGRCTRGHHESSLAVQPASACTFLYIALPSTFSSRTAA
eukprot:6458970-Amphidinium_carterae.1